MDNEETTMVEEAVTDEPATEQPVSEAVEPEPELDSTLHETTVATPDAERIEVPGGRNYETMFIVAVGNDANAASQRAKAVIEADGGVVDTVKISEMRRLAYTIKKVNEGVYVVFNGRFTKETATELERHLTLDETVLRQMTLRLED